MVSAKSADSRLAQSRIIRVMIHTIRTIDAHAAGEPLRLVVDGVPAPEGATMLEKRADLALVHKEALNIKPEWQTTNRAGIPWHPGALKYFKEAGIKVE